MSNSTITWARSVRGLKPTAKLLRAAFRINWSFVVLKQEEDTATHTYRYRVQAFALNPDNSSYASWIASSSSKERKFFCKSECPRPCKQDHDPLGMEAEMLAHNVLDRTVKRAFVALIRNVTGTSGDFQAVMDEDGTDDSPAPRRGRSNGTASGGSHGVCAEHNVAYFQSDKMRTAAHKNDDGSWCNKPDNEPPPAQAPDSTADLFGPPAERPSVDADGVIQERTVDRTAEDDAKDEARDVHAAVNTDFKPSRSRKFETQGQLLTTISNEFGVERSGVEDILKASGIEPLAQVALLTDVYDAVRTYANRGPEGG